MAVGKIQKVPRKAGILTGMGNGLESSLALYMSQFSLRIIGLQSWLRHVSLQYYSGLINFDQYFS